MPCTQSQRLLCRCSRLDAITTSVYEPYVLSTHSIGPAPRSDLSYPPRPQCDPPDKAPACEQRIPLSTADVIAAQHQISFPLLQDSQLPAPSSNAEQEGRAITYVVLQSRILYRPLARMANRARRLSPLRRPCPLCSCSCSIDLGVRPLGGAGAGHCACGRLRPASCLLRLS
jgi:hypothetical protein